MAVQEQPKKVEAVKIISKFPLYRLAMRSPVSALVERQKGVFERITTEPGSHLQFDKHMAFVDPATAETLRGMYLYGIDYISLPDWRKLRASKDQADKQNARNWRRDVARYARQREYLTEEQVEDVVDTVFGRTDLGE